MQAHIPTPTRIGRPPKPADERRETISLRLSALERRAIERAAQGAPLTTWLRERVLEAAARVAGREKRGKHG